MCRWARYPIIGIWFAFYRHDEASASLSHLLLLISVRFGELVNGNIKMTAHENERGHWFESRSTEHWLVRSFLSQSETHISSFYLPKHYSLCVCDREDTFLFSFPFILISVEPSIHVFRLFLLVTGDDESTTQKIWLCLLLVLVSTSNIYLSPRPR